MLETETGELIEKILSRRQCVARVLRGAGRAGASGPGSHWVDAVVLRKLLPKHFAAVEDSHGNSHRSISVRLV
jgi:hypothetical protein